MSALEDKNNTRYFMDGQQQEAQRLIYGHEVMLNTMGKAVHAPIDLTQPSLKILDSATASGVWLQDLYASLPPDDSKTFIGTDISDAAFPKDTPSNMSFTVQNIKQPWPEDWNSSFDLVHQRAALGAAGYKAVKEVLTNMIALLKPGGWIQMVEADHSVSQGPAMTKVFLLAKEVFKAMDTGPDFGVHLEQWFKECGLVNVQVKVFEIPTGRNEQNEQLREKSIKWNVWASDGLSKVVKGIPNSFSDKELDRLPGEVEKELTEDGGVTRLICAWGQRPS